MAEPEEVLIEGAHLATRLTRDLWQRWRPSGNNRPGLDGLRRRLQLVISALFGGETEIGPAEPPPPPTLLARLARSGPATPRSAGPLASTDGGRILLPPVLEDTPDDAAADRFLLLAIEQAARLRRGTGSFLPADPLERDLYLLAEAVAVDRELAARFPALLPELRESRAAAVRNRRPARGAPGRAVDQLLLEALAADPTTIPASFPTASSPSASRAWAKRQAAGVRRLAGRYRAPVPVPLWGGPPRGAEASLKAGTADHLGPEDRTRAARVGRLDRRPLIRTPRDGEDDHDGQAGTWIVRADDPQEKVEDPMGLQRPTDRDDQAEPGELAELLAELPEARLVRRQGPVAEILEGGAPLPPTVREARSVTGADGIVYPEWDWRARSYRMPGAIVRERVDTDGDPGWADRILRTRSGLVRWVRRDFERLRPRRVQRHRQPDGADVDIDAWVETFADLRASRPPDGRLYVATRPERPDAAITLLIDASASTDGWVHADRRVIDVEKEALVVVSEALAALGDPHAILSFSSHGPEHVGIGLIKRFTEPPGEGVRRRIAGLEPDGYTRLGAAIRHATTLLGQHAAKHRLLLMLSDGRPNDIDVYDGRYGVEDTRQAMAEARHLGIVPFCLTVDRDATRYGPRVFGPGHYAVVTHPAQLPIVLARLLGRLLRS